MVSAECEPFAKTGGLADVVDALARALGGLGHEVDVFLPRYRGLDPVPGSVEVHHAVAVITPTGFTSIVVSVWTGQADGYRIRLVDHPASFDRAGYYGEDGADYPDNGARFALLGRAALIAAVYDKSPFDIFHGHDWQSAPALLTLAMTAPPGHWAVVGIPTMLTCHNLAYHGWVPRARAADIGLGTELTLKLGNADGIDLLREAIRATDIVNTVSPTYARESRTPEYGAGLDDVLRARGDRYLGILNGIDTGVWDPATDAALPARYSREDVDGKATCRADLCARHGLDPGGPIFGVVGRLDPMKGFDLVAAAAPALLEMGARIIVLGTGDERLVRDLAALAADRPDRVAVIERFDRDEARRIYAGSDVFVMPSRFEPSGQGQLIALRYGTVPLVRHTGGLADTVFDADADAGSDPGNGFVFGPAEPAALAAAARRLVAWYADPERWRELMLRGMSEDHSWAGPARRYEAAYHLAITSERRVG